MRILPFLNVALTTMVLCCWGVESKAADDERPILTSAWANQDPNTPRFHNSPRKALRRTLLQKRRKAAGWH